MVIRSAVAVSLLLASTGLAHAAPSCAERLIPPPAGPAAPLRPVTALDLIELRDFGDPGQSSGVAAPFSLSPDGTRAALAIRRADTATNSYCYGILIVPLDGRPPHLADVGGEPLIAMTDYLGMADKKNGVVTGSVVAWSPDGTRLAYLRREQGSTQVWLAAPDGSAGVSLTHEAVDVRSFAWSEDGRSIRFTIRPGIAAAEAAFADESRSGWLYDRRFWPNAANHPLPVSSIPREERQIDVATGEVSVAGIAPSQQAAPKDATRVARSGDRLAWVSPRDPTAFLGPDKLAVRVKGAELVCDFEACADRVVGIWWETSGDLLFLHDGGSDDGGVLRLYRWRPGGGAPVQLFATDDLLIGCQQRGAELVCAQEGALQPRRLVAIDTASGRVRALFDPNPDWHSVRLGAVETLRVAAADGAGAFARLVLPPSHRPGERHPMVIVQYASRGFLRGGTGDEYPVFLLAERGFAVLSFHKPRPPATDIRVADVTAYVRTNFAGLADRRRIHSALQAAVAAAIARGSVDAERIGITGLSDGSSSVAFELLNSDRFRAAAISTCCDEPSFAHFVAGPDYAEVTKAWGYPAYGETGFWKDYSLALNAQRIRAPLLIQAADEEFRIALETVAALKAADRPVEMYVFPDEFHIKWQPRHRLAIYTRVIDWFDFWLEGRTDPDPAKAEQYRRWQALAAEQRAVSAGAVSP